MLLNHLHIKRLRKALILWLIFWLFDNSILSLAIVYGGFSAFSNWLSIWLANSFGLKGNLNRYLSHNFLPTLLTGYSPTVIFLLYLHKKFFPYLPKNLKQFTSLYISRGRDIAIFGIIILILASPAVILSYPFALNKWFTIILGIIKFSIVGTAEELMYRGWLFTLLYAFAHKPRKNKSLSTAIFVAIITNLVFSLSHIPTFLLSLNKKSIDTLFILNSFVPQFIAGTVFSILMIAKPNLLLLSIIHTASDWYSSLGIYLNCTISILRTNYCTDIAPTIINIILIAVYWKNIKRLFKGKRTLL